MAALPPVSAADRSIVQHTRRAFESHGPLERFALDFVLRSQEPVSRIDLLVECLFGGVFYSQLASYQDKRIFVTPLPPGALEVQDSIRSLFSKAGKKMRKAAASTPRYNTFHQSRASIAVYNGTKVSHTAAYEMPL
jgi:hypothetical protein